MTSPNALVVVPVVPYPDQSGQTARARNIMAALQQVGFRVDVLILDEQPPAPEAVAAMADQGIRLFWWRLPRWGKPLASFYSPVPEFFRSFFFHGLDRELAACGPFQLVWCDGLAVASAIPFLPGKFRCIVDFRDALSRFHDQWARKSPFLAERMAHRLMTRIRRAGERRGLKTFPDGVIISAVDRDWLACIDSRANRLNVVPLAFPIPSQPPGPPKGLCSEWLFLGDLRYAPNLESVRFLGGLMRRIASLEPTWRLTVVGAKPEGILLPTGPNIVYVGLVDRIEPYFQAAHAMLCPVFSGTGIKTKVLTAMAFRRPVIATAVALECIPAIDGVHVLQAETEDDFLAAMQRLVGDQTLQASLAIRAFELVRDHFSIQAISRNIASLVVQR